MDEVFPVLAGVIVGLAVPTVMSSRLRWPMLLVVSVALGAVGELAVAATRRPLVAKHRAGAKDFEGQARRRPGDERPGDRCGQFRP